ncbi:MAG: TlpA family protein disulfide reductase [Myxococcaceae bacterium]
MKGMLGLILILTACATARPAEVSREPLEFELSRLEGGSWRLSSERGHPVLLHFFSTWCGPCKTALPRDAALAERFLSKGLKAFAVSVDSDANAVGPFVAQMKLSMPVLLDTDLRVGDGLLRMRALPATYLFDAQGRLRFRSEGSEGSAQEEALVAEVERLFEASRPLQ